MKTVAISLMCFSGGVFANSTNLNVVAGTAFSRLSNQPYVSPVPGLINSYASNDPRKTRSFYGFGIEYNVDHLAAQPVTLGLALSFYSLGTSHISGIETPGINVLLPPQDRLSYNIQTKNNTILFEPKLVYTTFHVQPYVMGGLGYAKNTLRNFIEVRIPGSMAVPSTSPYPNHTQTMFAYEAGLGLQYSVGEDKNHRSLILHIEYRYLNLGQSRLGTAAAQTTHQHIAVNNTNNIVDFGLSYRL